MKIDTRILSDKITPDMLQPKTPGSAGIDLMAVNFPIDDVNIDYYVWTKDFFIYPNQCRKIGTGIAIHLQNPMYAAIVLPRSGLGTKGLILANTIGLIDSDYTGEIILSVWNRSSEPIRINQMDRIAQLIVIPVIQPDFNFVESFNDSERGCGGFGSTGINILTKE